MIRLSKPSSRVWPRGGDVRLEASLASRGTAISIAPSSPITLLLEYPLRL